jgi:N-acetylated-alpha-linked acidic dipeptidase
MVKLFVVLSALVMSSLALGADNLSRASTQSDSQAQLESDFDSHLNAEDLRTWMNRMSARPNHLGSAFGKENAKFIARMYQSWGFETEIETYYVLFPTPAERVLEMLEPVSFKASLEEPTLAQDKTSGQKDEQLPTYNAYSIDGDVTAELVYVNYGLPADYEELERHGISVEGKIALAKYYGSWRGIKPKVAAEHGAVATIIYSDPADDGFVRGDTYPYGGYRSAGSVQRGSVMDMPLYPGDPLTPGIGSTKRAKRLKLEDAPTLTKIPVLPISYSDAKPLLQALSGPVAPKAWQGALELPYHMGPGPAKVHLRLKFNWDTVELHNVIARMEGEQFPDQWVIRGNHKDAWVNGATDPISGLVAMMAEGKALGALAESGWRPKRTIIHAAWDGEEQGLLGSTEWAEHHAKELKKKAIAYINSDSNSNGYLGVGGSHSLEHLVNDVARDVDDPSIDATILERTVAARLLHGTPAEKKEALNRKNLRISPLGSGSDYTTFLQHLGIASINLGFRGEGEYGVYHSIYDSIDHYSRFMDKDFTYGVTLAKTAGRLVLRLSESEAPIFKFDGFVDSLSTYVEEVEQLGDAMREKTQEENTLIDRGVYELTFNSDKPLKAPARKDPVPHISYAGIKNALSEIKTNVTKLQSALDKTDFSSLSTKQRQKIDKMIYQSERFLTDEQGLPRRPWFKHFIYAPGFYTGYGVKTLPAIREAIEERKWTEVVEQEKLTALVLFRYSEHLSDITELLQK